MKNKAITYEREKYYGEIRVLGSPIKTSSERAPLRPSPLSERIAADGTEKIISGNIDCR
jgi:hypothetical protein